MTERQTGSENEWPEKAQYSSPASRKSSCVAIPEYIMKMVMQRVTSECVVVIDTIDNMGGSYE